MVVVQAFINISVVLGLMPTKGIPLPFVSYGGSSLFVTLACVGVLLNITKQAEIDVPAIRSYSISHHARQFWRAEAPADTSFPRSPSPRNCRPAMPPKCCLSARREALRTGWFRPPDFRCNW